MTNGLTSDILRTFQAQGKKTFSVREMVAMKSGDKKLAYKAITRLLDKKLIAPLAKGYYVIFSPAEFETRKCSANDVIDQLMQYKQADYYVGLLSAALYYGATHYRPMVFQVVTNKKIFKTTKQNTIKQLELHFKKKFPMKCIQKVNGQYGYINYSSPALTMYDLFKYENHVGGIDNIILVIKELLPELTMTDLTTLLSIRLENAYLQRLGYLLNKLNMTEFSDTIKEKITLTSVYIKFSRQATAIGVRNKAWRIIDNVNWDEVDDTHWND